MSDKSQEADVHLTSTNKKCEHEEIRVIHCGPVVDFVECIECGKKWNDVCMGKLNEGEIFSPIRKGSAYS